MFDADLPTTGVRRRLLGVLFAGSGIARIGFIAAVTVATLVAEDMLGSATFVGVPGAMATMGIALGTGPISGIMDRHGRRPGLVIGLLVASAGAVAAAAATQLGSFPLFVAGMFVFGFGNAADRLSRYAAADVSLPNRRSFAISMVVWAGTIGSVAGPVLLEPVQRLAEAIGVTGLVGPYLLAATALVVAAAMAFGFLRPDPLDFVPRRDARVHDEPVSVRQLLSRPRVQVAVVALVVGQVVMVLIMTMTPIHIRRAGEGLGIVGLVISAHTLGMFALSPLTGLISDRLGRIPVVLGGEGMLVVSAVMAAFAGGSDRLLLVASLFLLGLGWNFGFVAGSALLTDAVESDEVVRAQGLADALVWTSGAVAGVTSGIVMALGGYPVLSVVAAALVTIPLATLARLRPQAAVSRLT